MKLNINASYHISQQAIKTDSYINITYAPAYKIRFEITDKTKDKCSTHGPRTGLVHQGEIVKITKGPRHGSEDGSKDNGKPNCRKNEKSSFLIFASGLAALSLIACAKGPVGSDSQADGQYFRSGIIGGEDSTGSEGYAKTVAGLVNVTQGSLCTASILSDSILVTAAHCVDGAAPSDLRVIFGTNFKGTDRKVQPVVSMIESSIYPIHGNDEKDNGDIAVVRFSGGLPAGFHPATLLTDANALKNGAVVLLAGYGISDGVAHTGAGTLRSVEVTIQDSQYSKSELLLDQTHGKGACHGDSGGPAYVKVGEKWMLFGVTSRGVNDPRNDCSVSAAYTSIPFYMTWVKKTAAKLMKANSPARIAFR